MTIPGPPLPLYDSLGPVRARALLRRAKEVPGARRVVGRVALDFIVPPAGTGLHGLADFGAGETGVEELWQANLWKKGVDAMKDAAKAK